MTMQRTLNLAVLAVVLLFTRAAAQADEPSTVRIVARDDAKSELHFQSTDGEEETFSVERQASMPAGGGKPAAPARLDIKQGGAPVLSIVNGTVEVAGDLRLMDHGSVSNSLSGLSGQTQTHAEVVEDLLKRLETVNGTVDEHAATVAEHAGHFTGFLSTLKILKDRFPFPGVERIGTRSYRCTKTFHAQHRTDISGGTGTKKISLAAIRQIVPHWGSITIDAKVSSAYYNGGFRTYAGHWSYGGGLAWTATYTMGTSHGSLDIVDKGVVWRHPSDTQYDVSEKFVQLSVSDYAYVQVELQITTTYGHHFAKYDEADTAWTGAVWMQWGPDYMDNWQETHMATSIQPL